MQYTTGDGPVRRAQDQRAPGAKAPMHGCGEREREQRDTLVERWSRACVSVCECVCVQGWLVPVVLFPPLSPLRNLLARRSSAMAE